MFRLIFCGISWNEVAVEALKRNKKEEILQKRSAEFISVKLENIYNYQQAIEQQIQEKKKKIKE